MAVVLIGNPHIIFNTNGIECRHCKKVHETITHKCRPVVFTNPEKMELYVRKVTKTETHTDVDIISRVIGTPQAISVQEALRLDPEYLSHPFNQ